MFVSLRAELCRKDAGVRCGGRHSRLQTCNALRRTAPGGAAKASFVALQGMHFHGRQGCGGSAACSTRQDQHSFLSLPYRHKARSVQIWCPHPHKVVQQVGGHSSDVADHELVLNAHHPKVVAQRLQDLRGAGGQQAVGWAARGGQLGVGSSAPSYRRWHGKRWHCLCTDVHLQPVLCQAVACVQPAPRPHRRPTRARWPSPILRAASLRDMNSTYLHESAETTYRPFSRPAGITQGSKQGFIPGQQARARGEGRVGGQSRMAAVRAPALPSPVKQQQARGSMLGRR